MYKPFKSETPVLDGILIAFGLVCMVAYCCIGLQIIIDLVPHVRW